jgi:hypothetical protein
MAFEKTNLCSQGTDRLGQAITDIAQVCLGFSSTKSSGQQGKDDSRCDMELLVACKAWCSMP